MRILMFVGWRIRKCNNPPFDIQPPDYDCKYQTYWFFRHLAGRSIHVDVVDSGYRLKFWEQFEKKYLHFYIWQGLKNLHKLKSYDLILSHGAQSAVFLAFLRSLTGAKQTPHIIIDIGALNGGRDRKIEIVLFRFAMRSVSGLIYHVSAQKSHYQKFFPKLLKRSRFVLFGPDIELFRPAEEVQPKNYILSIGYAKRDWSTLISAYKTLQNPKPRLKILGHSKRLPGSLPEGIVAIERVPFREMIRQIAAARFIVVPLANLPYAIGQMTVLQSMAMGKAVIVPRIASMLDYITHGKDGLFYTPGIVADLREKMEYLIKNEGFATSLGINARLVTETKFNERLMAEGIWDAISHLIETAG